jgi:hypothetical protein
MVEASNFQIFMPAHFKMFDMQQVSFGPVSLAVEFFEFHILQEVEKLNDNSDLTAFSVALAACLNKGSDLARDLLQARGRHFFIEKQMVATRSVFAKWVDDTHVGDNWLDNDKRWSQHLAVLDKILDLNPLSAKISICSPAQSR